MWMIWMIISGSSLGNKIIWTVLGEKTSPGNYIGISLIVVVIRTKPVFYKDGFCFYTWKPGARHPALPIFVICFFDDNLGTSPFVTFDDNLGTSPFVTRPLLSLVTLLSRFCYNQKTFYK